MSLINKKYTGICLLLTAILWGTSFAFQKDLLITIDPLLLIFWNFGIGFIVLTLVVSWKKLPFSYRLREGLFLGALLAILEIFQMTGLHLSTPANTVFISNLGMLLIPYAGWILFRHTVSTKNTIALVLALLGMYLLVGGIDGFTIGTVLLLISALAMTLYFLYSQRFESEAGSHAVTLLAQQFLIITITSGALLLGTNKTFVIESSVLGNFLWQVVAFTIIPFSLVQWASRSANEMTVTIFVGIIESLIGGVVAWVFFSEPVTAMNVFGAFLMMFAFLFGSIFSDTNFLSYGKKLLPIPIGDSEGG